MSSRNQLHLWRAFFGRDAAGCLVARSTTPKSELREAFQEVYGPANPWSKGVLSETIREVFGPANPGPKEGSAAGGDRSDPAKKAVLRSKQPREPAPSGGASRRPDRPPRRRGRPTKRSRKRPGPQPFDADYYLEKLVQKEIQRQKRGGATEKEVSEAVLRLKGKSSKELALAIIEEFGVRVDEDGRKIRRHSKLYKEWQKIREALKAPKRARPARREQSKTPPRTRGECAEADVIDGQLTQRQSPNGKVRGGRTRADIRNDEEADAWLRENGVDPSDYQAE